MSGQVYRTKPVNPTVVDAIKHYAGDVSATVKFVVGPRAPRPRPDVTTDGRIVTVHDGNDVTVTVKPGQWLVRSHEDDVPLNYWVESDDLFKNTYETARLENY